MPILFDNSTPRGLTEALKPHCVTEARALGWDRLTNGDLLEAATLGSYTEVEITPPDSSLR